MLISKLEDTISKVKSYNPNADLDLINRAYVFSSRAHDGQKRKSGQPYLIHPLEVASILAEMKLDVSSIVAGMLHDTIEDTITTKAEILELFGADIAELVDGVTKISKLHFNSQEDQQAENFRKMIIAMSRDIRVILIKLADRLHNLRTLQYMPEEKQMRIAQETLDIYAPLANRMGIEWMRIQLEDLSFRFLKPDICRNIQKQISRLKKNREEYIERVELALRQHFGESIPVCSIQGRLKHAYGIFKKMERLNVSFEQIHDLMAFRILTNTVEECYEALGLLHSMWKPVPGRFKDYLAMPKTNHYQSLHSTVICLDGSRVEFQIRTYAMHEVAEKGIAAHWKYKEDGHLDMESENTFQWLRQLVEWQKELKDSIEFMDTVKLDLFSTDIYVFTPRGDVKALPYNATPVDLAYSIHTDVGAHCSGAKVNGRIVPLNYSLQSGDEVEIITNNNRKPSKDWLKFAASSRAKAKIREYLKQDQRDRSLILGRSLFEQECAKANTSPEKVFKLPEFDDQLKKRGLIGDQAFYAAVAYGKISLPVLFSHLFPDKDAKDAGVGLITKIFRKVSQRNKNVVQVGGVDEVVVTFGKCCHPVPGDNILGFVTRGRGVTLHRVECPKVNEIDPDRRVDVSWNANVDITRNVKLKVYCINRIGILADVAYVISEKKIGISKAIVRTTRDQKAVLSLDMGVKKLADIQSVIKTVEKIRGVMSVERELG